MDQSTRNDCMFALGEKGTLIVDVMEFYLEGGIIAEIAYRVAIRDNQRGAHVDGLKRYLGL